MKTLDEVIKAFEYTYENDPIAWTYGIDALHYLKELRHILDNTVWVGSTKEECGYWKLPTLPETGNDPLTWEQLKTMEGKPVWVVVDGKERWHIIREVSSEHLTLESMLPLHRCWMNHPDGWQAYRKERK